MRLDNDATCALGSFCCATVAGFLIALGHHGFSFKVLND